MFYLKVCLLITCMPVPCKEQKNESHPPELELLMVVSYGWVWVLGIKPCLLDEHPVLYQLSRLSSPPPTFWEPPPVSHWTWSFSLWLDWMSNKPQGCSFSASAGLRSQVNALSASGLISGPHACTTSTFNNWAILPPPSSGLLFGYFFSSIAIVPIVLLLIPHRIMYTPLLSSLYEQVFPGFV